MIIIKNIQGLKFNAKDSWPMAYSV